MTIQRACNPIRFSAPPFNSNLQALSLELEELAKTITEASEKVERVGSRLDILNNSVDQLSTVETLQALAQGDSSKTMCCICLDTLGSTEDSDDDVVGSNAKISLTKCGHLYCRKCLRDYINQGFAFSKCPTCRRRLHYHNDVVHVNPSLKEDEKKGEEFDEFVEQALEMLSKCGGRLPPNMWKHLFRSIAVPSTLQASSQRHAEFSAVPGEVLAHLRSCFTGVLNPKRGFVPEGLTKDSSWLSSKVKALLRDLPVNERSLVFATSKSTIDHLGAVLSALSIGHRTLCSGQNVTDTEKAICEWQSTSCGGDISWPVLLVQAGTAASGVTLTASCKMFLMEPFPRVSEEQQA